MGAAFGEPHTRRAFLADLLTALFAAVLAAAAVALVVLLLRSLRLFLHDFHHLPLLRGSASIQAGFLGLVLLVTPLGLRPRAAGRRARWRWSRPGSTSRTAERLALTAALLVVAAAPWAAQEAARSIAWTGTLAEAVARAGARRPRARPRWPS